MRSSKRSMGGPPVPVAEPQTPRRALRTISGRRARSLQEQRERALAAAVEVVAEHGYSSAFATRVTSHSGISRLTFHQLFDGGEGCLLAAFDRAVAQIAVEVTPAYRAGGSWRARIRAGLSALLAFLDREPDLCSLVVVHALIAGPRVLERRARVLATLIDVVEEGRPWAKARHSVKAGRQTRAGRRVKADDRPPALTAEGAVGAVFSVIHTRVLAQDSRPLLELLNPLTAMIVLPYLGHAAAGRELERPTPQAPISPPPAESAPATPRLGHSGPTILHVIATTPGLGNGQIAERVGLRDSGHISRLLLGLSDQRLIVNTSRGHPRGLKAWRLTGEGEAVMRGIERPRGRDRSGV
jgi:AcrR family transcriptional regulator